jgi:fumarylacetoacetase
VSADSDFPIQNLPYGVFRRSGGRTSAGVAIGDQVLDLSGLASSGMLVDALKGHEDVFSTGTLNAFMAAGPRVWDAVRKRISTLLREDHDELRSNSNLRERVLAAQQSVEMVMPAEVGDYTDFYSSKEHATNVGSMFRDPSNPLLPNWVHIPVGYHGRASSIEVSGAPVRRPCGQTKADDAEVPTFGPSRLLDFELEVGFFNGVANELGRPISTAQAPDHIFGLVLVNDWSARDIQRWEYVPLGPFLAKSFSTTISPWIVPLAALAPFRVPGPSQDPPVLPYLQFQGDWAYDLNLEVHLQANGDDPMRICSTNFKYMYWNVLQHLAHQSSGGVNVRPGDLYASGTVSGPTPDSYGSMLEICWRGTKPVTLPNGEQRKFVNDGDAVIMRGWCQGDGYRVGFGELSNQVVPAHAT